jgi:hypothetical protein
MNSNNKRKGAWLGLQWLNEGWTYQVRGGLGNKVISELKVEDGIIYIKNDDIWEVAKP